MKNTPAKTVSCPNCQKPVTWTEASTFRPFCCERCKLIDLGDWASGKHSIPGDPLLDDEDIEAMMRQNSNDS